LDATGRRTAHACASSGPVAMGRRTAGRFPFPPISPAAGRCRSSVVEHPLGKGEVVSSILTGSTTKAKQDQHLASSTLPSPPRLEREQDANPPAKVGENPGSAFNLRSHEAMSAITVSAELAASVEKMRRRWRNDHAAQAYEQGATPTEPDARTPIQALATAVSPDRSQSDGVGAQHFKIRVSRFAPRPCRRRLTSEERTKRRQRKRVLGGSSVLPDTLRHHYTEGERAVLCIVAGEVKRHGLCDLSIDEIADRAGTGRTTCQNAFHEARRLGHVEITERPQRGAKNLPNVVKVVSREWLAWIKRGPSAQRDRVHFFENVSTSKSWEKKEPSAERANRQQEAIRGVPCAPNRGRAS
jgi:hypothetical protein